MGKRTLTGLILVLFLSAAVGLVPIPQAARAADWTQAANNGITNPDNVTVFPGDIFKGKMAIGTIPTPWYIPAAAVTMYMYNGSTFTPVGEPGFGNADCRGLIPTASYRGELFIGSYDATNGGELFRWSGSGDPVLVPESENGWQQGNTYTAVMPLGVVDGELVVCVQNELPGWTGSFLLYKYNGNRWKQIVGGTSGVQAGFGNPNNITCVNLFGERTLYDGKLIFVVQNMHDGLSVYSYDGSDFDRLGRAGDAGLWDANQVIGVCTPSWVEGKIYLGTCNAIGKGQVWSYDGEGWTQVSTNGIDNAYMATLVLARGSSLYASAWSNNGCRLFERDGTDWNPISEANFGQPAGDLNGLVAMKFFGGKMVATTANNNGGEVWTAPAPSTFYFAEGTTRDNPNDGSYEEWLSIQNPGAIDANVTMTYMLGDGTTEEQKIKVPKTSRATVGVNDFLGPDRDVSTMVESDQPIVAERPMYFKYRNKWFGGDNVMGLMEPRNDFYFAEGTTRDNANDGSYEEWLCVQNPGLKDANLEVTYLLGTGQNVTKEYVVKKTSRKTIDVNLDVGVNQDVSTIISSDQPIVAERPMYFNYRNKWAGGHNVMGGAGADTDFYFAEGTTRDNATDGSYEEWLCLQNANAAKAEVEITYYTSSGANVKQDITVPARSRMTVDVKLKLGADVDASCRLHSDQPILVERPMYFNFRGAWAGGHNVIGCAGPMRGYNFAEGTTRSGFSTWVAVMNTSSSQANVTFRYMMADGTNKEVKVKVAARQRYTREVLSDVGPDQDVSIEVEADRDVVAERPMYFDYHEWGPGGSDTLGLTL